MNPQQQADYRSRTNSDRHYGLAQKTCRGACRRRRSVGQFAQGDDVCVQCRLRSFGERIPTSRIVGLAVQGHVETPQRESTT